jgi:hypothetical protein
MARNRAQHGGGKRAKRRRAPVSPAAVRAAAIAHATMADAERELGIGTSLSATLDEFGHLAEAWKRGRLLRSIRGLASAAATVQEAAQSLDMSEESLRDLLERDREVRDIWNQARISTAIAVKAGLVSAARDGKAAAVANVMAVLRREIAQPRVDYLRLPVNQAEIAIGVTRQTLHDWRVNRGAPCNSDGSINLPALWSWHEGYVAARAGLPSARASGQLDPLKLAKAQRLQQDLARDRGELLDRSTVVAGLVARHQLLVAATQRADLEWSGMLANQPPERISELLRAFFSELRRHLAECPDWLRLPKWADDGLADLLRRLDSQHADGAAAAVAPVQSPPPAAGATGGPA